MDNAPVGATPPATQPPVKKGLHPLAWVGIGCGALIVLGVVGFLVLGVLFYGKARQNVQIQGGKAVINTPSGKMTINTDKSAARNELPAWFAAYPGATVTGNVSMKNPKSETVTVMFETADPAEKVLSYYEQAFQKAQFEVSTFKQGEGGVINGTDKAHGRTAIVAVSAGQGKTSISATCETKTGVEPAEKE